MLTKLILVFLGSGLGGLCRYGLYGITARAPRPWSAFPVGTLLINTIGCLLIGIAAQPPSPHASRHPSQNTTASQ